MVTLKEHDDDPQEFVAVHVTDVVPKLNDDPAAGLHTTVGAGEPDAVGFVHVTMGLSHWTMLEGHAPITGA